MPGDQRREGPQCFFGAALGLVGINRRGIEDLAGGIDNGDLGAGPETRVKAEDDLTEERRLS